MPAGMGNHQPLKQTRLLGFSWLVLMVGMIAACSESSSPESGVSLSPSTLTESGQAVNAAPTQAIAALPADVELAIVDWVTDGDTINVQFENGSKDTVRFFGIDSPETDDPDQPPECYGDEATQLLRGLISPGDRVYLEPGLTERDRYDRLLRYGWVLDDAGNPLLVNEWMVAQGAAIVKTYPPDDRYETRYQLAQAAAQQAGAGLWGACGNSQTGLAVPTVAVNRPDLASQPPPENCGWPPADVDCPQLTQPCANWLLARDPSDPFRLDSDHNGVPCEGPRL